MTSDRTQTDGFSERQRQRDEHGIHGAAGWGHVLDPDQDKPRIDAQVVQAADRGGNRPAAAAAPAMYR
jgi:hypothetical protein